MACDHSLKLADFAHQVVEPGDAFGVAGRGHQCLGFLDRRCRVGLITKTLAEFGQRRGELRERIDEAAHHHRRDVLHHVDQHRLVEHEVEGPAHSGIVERLLLVVHPGRLDDALVEVHARHALGRLDPALRHRIEQTGIIDTAGEQAGAELGRERQGVIELDAVEIGQALVPVVLVLLHHPDLGLDAALALERAGAGNVDDATQVVAGCPPGSSCARCRSSRWRCADMMKLAGRGCGELELHDVCLSGARDLLDRGEQRAARDAKCPAAAWRSGRRSPSRPPT